MVKLAVTVSLDWDKIQIASSIQRRCRILQGSLGRTAAVQFRGARLKTAAVLSPKIRPTWIPTGETCPRFGVASGVRASSADRPVYPALRTLCWGLMHRNKIPLA
jgi:hypothetical protein